METFYRWVVLVLASITVPLLSMAQEQEKYASKTIVVVQAEAVKLVEQYEKAINGIGKNAAINIEDAKADAEELISLFINRNIYVANDLDPANSLSKFYEIETYANNLILWYKEGIEIEMAYKEAKVTNIIKHAEEVYSIDVLIHKKTNGNYMDKSLNKNFDKLIFRIAFTLTNQAKPSNFKIAGIREAGSDQIADVKTMNDLNSEKLPEEQEQNIYSLANTALNDYINFLTLIADPDELEEDKVFYREKFLSSFKNEDAVVFNDLSQKPKEKAITIKQYLESFENEFPEGLRTLKFSLDSAEYSKVKKIDKNRFYILVYVFKFFSVLPENKKLYRNNSDLTIKIEFEQNEKNYTNFKIASIEANNILYANVAASTENIMPTLELRELSRKGFIIGALGGIGMHEVYSSDVINSETTIGTKDWSYSSEFTSYSAGLTLSAYFSNRFGLLVGAEYNRYATTYNLSGEFTDYDSIYPSQTSNDTWLYLNIDADYDSTIFVQTVSFPIQFAMHTCKAGKFGGYGKIGASFTFPVYASYKATGSYIQNGSLVSRQEYSPITHMNGNYINGYEREGTTEGKLQAYSGMSVNLSAAAGIEYYLSYFVSLQAGVYYEKGFGDIEPDKSEYVDIHHKAFPHEKTSLDRIGFNIGLNYKL